MSNDWFQGFRIISEILQFIQNFVIYKPLNLSNEQAMNETEGMKASMKVMPQEIVCGFIVCCNRKKNLEKKKFFRNFSLNQEMFITMVDRNDIVFLIPFWIHFKGSVFTSFFKKEKI